MRWFWIIWSTWFLWQYLCLIKKLDIIIYSYIRPEARSNSSTACEVCQLNGLKLGVLNAMRNAAAYYTHYRFAYIANYMNDILSLVCPPIFVTSRMINVIHSVLEYIFLSCLPSFIWFGVVWSTNKFLGRKYTLILGSLYLPNKESKHKWTKSKWIMHWIQINILEIKLTFSFYFTYVYLFVVEIFHVCLLSENHWVNSAPIYCCNLITC